MFRLVLLLSVLALSLTACTTIPAGPTVPVMPGPGKTFEAFQVDDAVCRQWALQQTGAVPSKTAQQNVASGAAVGTAVGAGLGAAVGAATGNVGAGAAIGGATGFVGGTSMGSSQGYASEWQLQRRYDIAYQQCMYAKGNQLPMLRPRPVTGYPAPAYATPVPSRPAPTSPTAVSDSIVTVPGQWVGDTWVPEHKVEVPPSAQR